MAQVAINIAGRVYRVACDEGEEEHLGELAKLVDGKIAGMRQQFGEMGDQRLTVMAAVTIADELSESRRRVSELEAELAEIRGDVSNVLRGRVEWLDRIADSLSDAAARIETAAQDLNGAGRGEE